MSDKYLLWAPSKGYHHNSPVFWGKGNCGYYSTLEDCQVYSYEEALSHANEDTIPVELDKLLPHSKTTFHECMDELMAAAKVNPNRNRRG